MASPVKGDDVVRFGEEGDDRAEVSGVAETAVDEDYGGAAGGFVIFLGPELDAVDGLFGGGDWGWKGGGGGESVPGCAEGCAG